MAVETLPACEVSELIEPEQELLDEIKRIEARVFPKDHLDEWMLRPLSKHGKIFVLYYQDQVAGVSELMADWDDPYKTYMYGFYIREEFQGEGLGSYFMEEVLDSLADEGLRRVELTVDPFNEPACHIYIDKIGFEVEAYKEDYFGEGEDRLLLSKEI